MDGGKETHARIKRDLLGLIETHNKSERCPLQVDYGYMVYDIHYKSSKFFSIFFSSNILGGFRA
jgi:hypothetical protein